MVLERAASSFLVVLAISGCASAGGGPARPRTDRVGPAFADVRKVELVFRRGVGFDPQKLIQSVAGKVGLW